MLCWIRTHEYIFLSCFGDRKPVQPGVNCVAMILSTGRTRTRCFLPSIMRRSRKRPSSATSPTDDQPPSPVLPAKLKKRRAIFQPRAEDHAQGGLVGTSSSGIVSPVASSSQNQLVSAPLDEPGPSKESGWKTAYGAARMAVDIAKESSDMFLPLKAVVGALSVLIKNYDVSPLPMSYPINR